MIFVSYIMATFNEKKNSSLIQKSIDLIGTNPKCELIIKDGESNDGTFQNIILKNTLLIVKKDSGIYDAWNYGLSFATGKYISFIGASDIPNMQFVDRAFEVYSKNLKTPMLILGNATRRLGQFKRTEFTQAVPDLFKDKKYLSFGFVHQGSLNHYSLFNAEVNFRTKFILAADLDFYLRNKTLIKNNILKIEEIQADVMYDGKSTTLSGQRIYKSEYKLIESDYQVCLKRNLAVILASKFISEKLFYTLRKISWWIKYS